MKCLSAVLFIGLAASAAAAQEVEIREWPVPWEASRPRDPYPDAQGRVWFVGQVGNYLAWLDPASGEFKRYELEERTLPHNLIVDGRGVWYAGNANGRIGLLDPATGKTRTFMMPDPAARDPHTLVLDAKGDLWFTVQNGGFIGHLATKTGEVRLVKVPQARARPYGIALDAGGRPWVNLFGTNRIATVDPATLALEEIELPRAEARTRRIAITRDQKVWYVDYEKGFLGRLDPATRKVDEWAAPSGAMSRPYAMAVDANDRIWFVETGVQPNRLVGFDPVSQSFFSNTAIPSGGGTVRHMAFDAAGRTLWFGTDVNTIGRAVIR